MNLRSLVGFGILGPVLDRGIGAGRWEQWRPTVSIFQHEELRLDRFELFYESKFTDLVEGVAADIVMISPETKIQLRDIEFDDPWDFEEVFGKLHDFARSYPFDPETEDYLVHITTGSHVQQICLFLLTESRHFPGRLVQTAPPKRKDSNEPGRYTVIDLDLSRYDRLAARFQSESNEARNLLKSGIATRNREFNRLIEQIERVAIQSRAPMLLMGPTGAGKSQLARRIYELKKARHQLVGPFVEVNCATLRGDAVMSALFGHVKGAFTGAIAARMGYLRTADGGVLFLDEIGELGPDEQAMLLRAVETKCFFPVGSDVEIEVDFQLIGGTNRDLHDAVSQGRFREDLLARINLWSYRLPPLRERLEDLEPNLDYELEKFRQRSGQQISFNREARDRFLRFSLSTEAEWHGNFRDLNNAVFRMATLATGRRITVDLVEEEIDRLKPLWRAPDNQGPEEDALRKIMSRQELEVMDSFDQVQLSHVIGVCRRSASLSDAGRKLYEVSRLKRKDNNDSDRLRKYLMKFGLSWKRVQSNHGHLERK